MAGHSVNDVLQTVKKVINDGASGSGTGTLHNLKETVSGLPFMDTQVKKLDAYTDKLKEGRDLVHKLGGRSHGQAGQGGHSGQAGQGGHGGQAGQAAAPKKAASGPQFGPWLTDGLRIHNQYRQRHGAPPMQLNQSLCDLAQDWANRLAREGQMYHRPNNNSGENIYYKMASGGAPQVPASEATTWWYNEVSNYTYGSGFNMSTGHFTQLVWKSSTQLGMAKASANGKTFVVANYHPKGNMQGQFSQNVLPPRN